MEERLQKYLANCGVASRRKCEEYIIQGKVKVNGEIITQLGIKINPEKDIVEFENKIVKENKKYVYILLNKPIGYVTTVEDQFNRDTVLNLVKVRERVVPVGRLDMYTSGALLLSDDGEFINSGSIIYRQRGTKIHPGTNVRRGTDDTLYATISGYVKYEHLGKDKKQVSVYPER